LQLTEQKYVAAIGDWCLLTSVISVYLLDRALETGVRWVNRDIHEEPDNDHGDSLGI